MIITTGFDTSYYRFRYRPWCLAKVSKVMPSFSFRSFRASDGRSKGVWETGGKHRRKWVPDLNLKFEIWKWRTRRVERALDKSIQMFHFPIFYWSWRDRCGSQCLFSLFFFQTCLLISSKIDTSQKRRQRLVVLYVFLIHGWLGGSINFMAMGRWEQQAHVIGTSLCHEAENFNGCMKFLEKWDLFEKNNS